VAKGCRWYTGSCEASRIAADHHGPHAASTMVAFLSEIPCLDAGDFRLVDRAILDQLR
jgi:hypothetical protein